MAKKHVPDTFLIECKDCKLVLRFDEEEFHELSELPTFCHLIPANDLDARRKECPKPKFKKPKGI